MNVETQVQADQLNRDGVYGPYRAANGHLMYAELRFPRVINGHGQVIERPLRVGDEIRYESWSAWCSPECNHSELGQLEDW